MVGSWAHTHTREQPHSPSPSTAARHTPPPCQAFINTAERRPAPDGPDRLLYVVMLCAAVPCCAVQRGNLFADTSTRARATIAELGARFIRPGSVILVHGHSRVVLALLQRAVASVSGWCGVLRGRGCAVLWQGEVGWESVSVPVKLSRSRVRGMGGLVQRHAHLSARATQNMWWLLLLLRVQDINFSVIVTEGRPDGTGETMARQLDALGVPVTLVLDSGVAYALER